MKRVEMGAILESICAAFLFWDLLLPSCPIVAEESFLVLAIACLLSDGVSFYRGR